MVRVKAIIIRLLWVGLALMTVLIRPARSDNHNNNSTKLGLEGRINSICSKTMYPDLCLRDMRTAVISAGSGSGGDAPLLGGGTGELIAMAFKLALQRVNDAYHLAANLSAQQGNLFESSVLSDCGDLMGNVGDLLNKTVAILTSVTFSNARQELPKIRVLLSSSLGMQTACTDGFGLLADKYSSRSVYMLSQQTVVSKGIVNCFGATKSLNKPASSSATASNQNSVRRGLWVPAHAARKLLQAAPGSNPNSAPNVTVAQDGSGNYQSVQQAVDDIQEYEGRYVIYIKAGTYNEVVTVPKWQSELTFLGDGIGRTIITSDRNVAIQTYTTYRSATVAVSAPGFMAKGITFRNTAGPQGHQAVALRVNGDLSVFDSCSFEGYQDTLYALAGRQTYQNCDIYGTVDYIFGNAIAVFENCRLYARLPLSGQQNTYTAQGRKIPDDPSGYSFQNCTVTAANDLAAQPIGAFPTFLGRPWKAYARTVFMQSYLGPVVDPAGWLAWNASHPFEDTLYYGEYENTGPGSTVSRRVSWPGVHSMMTPAEAVMFSPTNFFATGH